MKQLYVVFADGRDTIRAFDALSEAEGFAEECREYAASRPGAPRPRDFDDPADEARWDDETDRWLRAIEKWDAAWGRINVKREVVYAPWCGCLYDRIPIGRSYLDRAVFGISSSTEGR